VTTRPSAPLVTIGLPVYNGERFVVDAISSLLGQVDIDFELVVADNASTDSTLERCHDAAGSDPRVSYLTSDDNRGAAWNYNRLVHHARGTYFKWAAHDDVCAPTFVSRCVSVLEANPDVVVAYPRAVDIDESGAVVKEYPAFAYATERSGGGRARSVLRNPSPCFETFGVVRRADLLRTGLIGPYTSSDRTLLLELALLGRFVELDEVLFFHRQHAARSVTRYRGARSRTEWFDPAAADRFTFARWRLVGEHVRAVARAPVPVADKLVAAGSVPAWMAANRRRLVREPAAWVLHRARRTAGARA
jgi:glycosyltransferase involved in cell wall biosynthesis